jgi:hypothetical protein
LIDCVIVVSFARRARVSVTPRASAAGLSTRSPVTIWINRAGRGRAVVETRRAFWPDNEEPRRVARIGGRSNAFWRQIEIEEVYAHH